MGNKIMPEDALIGIKTGVSTVRTICEVWREVYDQTEDLPTLHKQAIRALILEGYIMGKKCHLEITKLTGTQDHMKWGGIPNLNFEKSKLLRKERNDR